MVFVDAKTVYMWEEDIRGWVDTSVPNFVEGIRPAYSGGKIIRVKYYAAAHSRLGAFFLRFYTGTTGMTAHHDGHSYQVRSHHKQLRGATCLHMSHSMSQLGCPQIS
jgi:hypothetical protein